MNLQRILQNDWKGSKPNKNDLPYFMHDTLTDYHLDLGARSPSFAHHRFTSQIVDPQLLGQGHGPTLAAVAGSVSIDVHVFTN